MRNFYWPVAKASFRVGLTHDFALTDKLSIIPNIWLDGGSARWNRQRFGYQNAARIGSGVNSFSLRHVVEERLVDAVAGRRDAERKRAHCVGDDGLFDAQ